MAKSYFSGINNPMAPRNIYLHTLPVPEALERARAALDRAALVATQRTPTHEAAGRVTAAPIYAHLSSPPYHSAAMDGYAVRAEDTFGAREEAPLKLEPGRTCFAVNTGQALPENTNAVIRIEDIITRADGALEIEAAAYPWMHVRRVGDDVIATELLLPQNHLLSPYDIGALLTAGVWEVDTWEPIRLTFVPTGDEVLDFTTRPTPQPGQVVESNSQIFQALAHQWGAVTRRVPPVPDDPERLRAAVQEALESDAHLVVVGAGSSAGSKDFTRQVFESLGQILVHGLAVSPGKPTLLAVAQGKLLVGAPGFPSSAIVCFEEIVAPLVAWLGHRQPPLRPRKDVKLTRKTASKLGTEEILRLAVGTCGEQALATPFSRGAGLLSSLTRAQALARIPANSEGIEQGAELEAELLVPEANLERVLLHVGSHDNTLDLLSNELMGLADPYRLVSTHVGSLGGLTALKDGSAMISGCHLFDPHSQDFNFPFLARYVPDIPLTLVNLAIRHQGLIVAAGNPKDIQGLADLTRADVNFVNRQRGAGTRILLDHHLQQTGIAPRSINGYQREEHTHMAVAINISSGAADCGLGIFSAARALDLDFVPLASERYDLLIPNHLLDDPRIVTLLELLRTTRIREKIAALGGYEVYLTGEIMTPGLGLGR
ncbi:molybdopterin biosynthesis protein [Geoalkalibacter halelectricus]|uniref:Molybdopterin molybdenumtransferase n=2 Tax=Geoalkalibacter halelectricus TaxID=2847045 RepID=A0ABY5ZMJ7_9BACT|nr:molybdopterin biosynthesis protein [Geoalkalibacter halelectricus]UWZ80382.1 molybdopterin biosynthesis protein [Geoalkalibacter halelectricus]